MAISEGWQMDVQTEHALDIYRTFWPGCEVIENDALAKDESVAKLLDFGDVDKIINLPGKQIHMAQRFRKPYYSKQRDMWVDPDFTLRYNRPTTDNIVEYERLMKAHESNAVAYPRCYSFGRVYNDASRGLYELYILDTDRLITSIKDGLIEETGPIPTGEGQEFMSYDVKEIISEDIVVHKWSDTTKPDNPENITSW